MHTLSAPGETNIIDFKSIKYLLIDRITDKSFCYAITRDNECLYIGKTKRGIIRLREHKLIEISDIILIWTTNNVDKLERSLIKIFKPRYNSHSG